MIKRKPIVELRHRRARPMEKTTRRYIEEEIAAAVKAEREACAKIADDFARMFMMDANQLPKNSMYRQNDEIKIRVAKAIARAIREPQQEVSDQ